MSDKSTIEWTDATLNLVVGCTQVSPGCDNCYAKYKSDVRDSKNPKSPRFGIPFETLTFHPERIKMLKAKAGKRIFVNSMSDMFHKDIPTATIEQAFADMIAAPQHTFQILTKRPERMRRVVTEKMVAPNIHLGVSIENMDYAWRAEMLSQTPAAVRFLSCEPLLGPLPFIDYSRLDWVIVGGESGRGWRPMDLDWAREIRDLCADTECPFFFKQVSHYSPTDGMIPADLRIREYPGDIMNDPLTSERLSSIGARLEKNAFALNEGRAYAVCPRCQPFIFYSGPVVWKTCQSCVEVARQRYGSGRYD